MAIVLQKCCFCVDIKSGTLVFEILNLVGCFLTAACCVLEIANWKGEKSFCIRIIEAPDEELELGGNGTLYVCVITIVLVVLSSAGSAAIIIGIKNKMPKLLIPPMILRLVFFALIVISATYAASSSPEVIVEWILITAFNLYVLVVLYSCYRVLLEDQHENLPIKC